MEEIHRAYITYDAIDATANQPPLIQAQSVTELISGTLRLISKEKMSCSAQLREEQPDNRRFPNIFGLSSISQLQISVTDRVGPALP